MSLAELCLETSSSPQGRRPLVIGLEAQRSLPQLHAWLALAGKSSTGWNAGDGALRSAVTSTGNALSVLTEPRVPEDRGPATVPALSPALRGTQGTLNNGLAPAIGCWIPHAACRDNWGPLPNTRNLEKMGFFFP